MLLGTIARITGGKLSAGRPEATVDPSRMTTDTRTLRRGDLFIALEGPRHDGRAFVAEAFQKGASGAIVRGAMTVPPGKGLIAVGDTTKALHDIAAYHRSRFRIPVVAVTGSNGKTTVKEMIAALLAPAYRVLKSEGTKNNHIGVPQTLLKLTPRHEVCVLELGMNHAGEITRLGRIARQTVAVVTNIGPSHLEFLGGLDGVFAAKREILRTFDRRRRGTAVLNGDDPFLSRVRGRGFRIVRYGLGEGTDPHGAIVGRRGAATVFTAGGASRFTLPLLGDHNVSNALAAIAVGRMLGVTDAAMRRALERFRGAAMRLAVQELDGLRVINDAYNSNPLSMAAALEALNHFPAAGKWVVSADMLELGGRSADFHRKVGAMVARSSVRGLLTYGTLSRHTFDRAAALGMPRRSLWHCTSHDEIASILSRVAKRGDVVLLKGSRSMKMERVLDKMAGRE